jgi:hypothetical protein
MSVWPTFTVREHKTPPVVQPAFEEDFTRQVDLDRRRGWFPVLADAAPHPPAPSVWSARFDSLAHGSVVDVNSPSEGRLRRRCLSAWEGIR